MYQVLQKVMEGTFLIGGGGWAGASEGRVIGEGQTCFLRNQGRVTGFFGKEKITPCRLVDSYLLTNTRSL